MFNQRTTKEPILIRFHNGLFWEFAEYKNLKNNEVGFRLYRGPLCPRKKCLSDMEYLKGMFRCKICGEEVITDMENEKLVELAKCAFAAEARKKYCVVNLDKLPAINEKLEENNKYFRVSMEHDLKGNPKDLHILIGRKDNNGKHAHIILSPEGEARFDKKDLPPSEEIGSMGFIVFKHNK